MSVRYVLLLSILVSIGTVLFCSIWFIRSAAIVPASDLPSDSSQIHTVPLTRRQQQDLSIRKATEILYKDSPDLNHWLGQPPPTIYIYDTLDEQEFSIPAVSRCVDAKFNSDGSNNCGWKPEVCDENTSGSYPYYNLYRTNFLVDIVLLQSFLRYNLVTKDPDEADLFVVPYPHKSHCMCKQEDHTKIMCKYDFAYIQDNILSKLLYFNETTNPKHLFVFGADWDLANPPFRRMAKLQLSLGPAAACRKWNQGGPDDNCGSFVIPYVNTGSDFQPSAISERSRDWWITRPRKYSLTAIMGSPEHLVMRNEFFNNWNTLLGKAIGGLPVYITDNGSDRNLRRHDVAMDVYRNSTFCLILPGDDCGQKRFFDVSISGCIPVVMAYNVSDDDYGYPTWFKRSTCSIRRAYPFARGTFATDRTAGIDYTSFVVQIDAEGVGCAGLGCIKPTLERLIGSPAELKMLRSNLAGYAQLFSYGMSEELNGEPDAFSSAVVVIRHYLKVLRKRQERGRHVAASRNS